MIPTQFKKALKGHPRKQQERMALDLARRNALTFVEYEDLMRFIEADQIMQNIERMARESEAVRNRINQELKGVVI